jgi:hypothetical protein
LDRDEERKQKIIQKRIELVELPVAYEYSDDLEDFLKTIEGAHQKALDSISIKKRSFFSDKDVLLYVKNLVNLSHEMGKINVQTMMACEFLYRKTELMEEIMKKMLDKMEKMPDLKDVEELKSMSRQLSAIDSVIGKIQAHMSIKEKDAQKQTTEPESNKKGDTSYVR